MIRESSFVPDDFMAVTPSLVQDFDQDVIAALVAIRIRYRTNRLGEPDDAGTMWLAASLKDLAADTGLSYNQVRRAIERMVKAGWLARRDVDPGAVAQYRVVTMGSGTNATPPWHESHTPLAPEPDHSPLIEEVEEEQELLSADADGSLPGLGASPAKTANPLRGFDEFYAAYPRHVGKGAARTKYEVAVKKGRATPEELLAAAQRYAGQCRGKDPKYIPHPATWLSQERWDDDDAAAAAKHAGAADGNGDHWRAGGGFWGGGK